MVLLRNNNLQAPSRKRPSNAFSSPFIQPPNKIPKSSSSAATAAPPPPPPLSTTENLSSVDKMASILADAGCTLLNPTGQPCVPADLHKLRLHLNRLFSSDEHSSLRSQFLSSFSSYISSPNNFRRVLLPSQCDNSGSARSESLVRVLLLVPSIQLDILIMLLEKLPEYFDSDPTQRLDEDISRLILNQFRWLDFLVDSEKFTENLFQVLSISPPHLKKEIIGSLPEIIGDNNNKTVVDSLEKLLQDDSTSVVAVIDCFSNLNLDDLLQEKVITIALSCIRTVDAENLPYLLRYLLLSATPINTRRIISQFREQYKLVGVLNTRSTQHNKLKGKSIVNNVEGSVLDALGSSLRFKSILCQEILNELKCLERPQDHKVIDIWLLMLIYVNNESMQKSVEKIFKKKIVGGCIQEVMFEQCICGNKDLVQDYFPSFLSLSEYLMACREQKAREFSIHIYMYMFEGFADMYSRQEVLGALVTHVGSGVTFEVSSALEAMVLLASRYSQELVPLSSHISGILDYLEGFNVECLHKVYEVFCLLALSSQSRSEPFRSSTANELMMIVRKQVSSTELKYKKMGLIGTLKIVSHLVNANTTTSSSYQKLTHEEALELLKTSLNSCKQLPLPLILFYDELSAMLSCSTIHPSITEWIGKHVGEFESLFLCDLENGRLPGSDSFCGLEGELWMNLDGDISPICINILPLVSSVLRASSIQFLPANFRLLSEVERLANQGSLGGIDALLGCPLHLPSPKYFVASAWLSLNVKEKHILCLSLYYAVNWIRELLNAFCTQISGKSDCISQATKEDINKKLLKRLRNLVYLEGLLNNFLEQCPFSLPELCSHVEPSSSSFPRQPNHGVQVGKKREHGKSSENSSENGKIKDKKMSKGSRNSETNGKVTQPTVVDVWRKAGAIPSQDVANEDSVGSKNSSENDKIKDKKMSKGSSNSETNGKVTQPRIVDVWRKAGAIPSQDVANEDSVGTLAKGSASGSVENQTNSTEPLNVEISTSPKLLEAQQYKFRPLSNDCFSIWAFQKNLDSCCADPASELPLHLYLLRDLHRKLEFISLKPTSARCLSSPPGSSGITGIEFLSIIQHIFPTLKGKLDSAVSVLDHGCETCQDHWNFQSALAGNPEITNMVVSASSVSSSVVKETLRCFSKLLNLPQVQMEKAVLSDLLEAFQVKDLPDCSFSGMKSTPSPRHLDYLYCGSYSFLEAILGVASSFSFTLAFEVVFALESVVLSVRSVLDKSVGNGNDTRGGVSPNLLSALTNRLGASAQKLLKHNWDHNNLENGWKGKGEMVQKIVHIFLENCESPTRLLDELACSTLPKVYSSRGTTNDAEDCHGFTTLCSATFAVWYRELHERNLVTLVILVKEAMHLQKSRADSQHGAVEALLNKLQQSVNVVVSLISLCRANDKVGVRAMAVKYGGKFVGSFLKVFDFLQNQFHKHNEVIIQLVKELQKATRTIQILCSEAKGLKQIVITSKIPATKRFLERFLFRVKALLHTTSSGCTVELANLKHKDLTGQVVSSQAYLDELDESLDEEDLGEEAVSEDQLTSAVSD